MVEPLAGDEEEDKGESKWLHQRETNDVLGEFETCEICVANSMHSKDEHVGSMVGCGGGHPACPKLLPGFDMGVSTKVVYPCLAHPTRNHHHERLLSRDTITR